MMIDEKEVKANEIINKLRTEVKELNKLSEDITPELLDEHFLKEINNLQNELNDNLEKLGLNRLDKCPHEIVEIDSISF